MNFQEALYEYLVRFGDTSVIMGQRLAEWCSRGPLLEEDLALTNVSLDYFGQAETFYNTALEVKPGLRNADALAFHRDERAYANYLLAEIPNGNFACTQMKIFLLATFLEKIYTALSGSELDALRIPAMKSVKEIKYHVRHSRTWLFRLSHGTIESASKVAEALQELWRYTDDLFQQNDTDKALAPMLNYALAEVKQQWLSEVESFFDSCQCTVPQNTYMITGGIDKMHTEALGHILCEMQYLQRSYPDAQW